MKRLILSAKARRNLMHTAIEFYGNKGDMAAALGVKNSAISLWLARGEIPARRGVQIERDTGGKLKAVMLAGEIHG